MNRRMLIRSLLSAGAAAAIPPSLLSADNFVIRSDVRLVLLDVSVRDRDGGFITGLAQDHFHVYENNVPQKISVFASNELPVTLGVLVDQSRSMTPKQAEVIAAAGALIDQSNPQDEMFVLHFNDFVDRGLRGPELFSGNREILRAALRRGTPQGRTALYDAVAEGLTTLGQGRRDKKALVLISDGGDNASTHGRSDVIGKLERSLATVYAVGIFSPDDPDNHPGLLRQLARISGGEAYFPAALEDLDEICRGIAKDIRTRYTVGYVPPASGSAVRRIKVQLTVPGRSGLRVRSRTVYRYDTGIGS